MKLVVDIFEMRSDRFTGYLLIMLVVQNWVTVPESLSFIKSKPDINVSYQYDFLRCPFGFVVGMRMYLGYREGFGKQLLGNGYTLVLSIKTYKCTFNTSYYT